MTVVETINDIYAKELLTRFNQIKDTLDNSSIRIEDIEEPLMTELSNSHQNVSGNLYRGVNKVYLPFFSSMHKKRIPIWMTVGQMRDMGIWFKAGSRNASVMFYNVFIKDTQTGKRSDVSVEDFDLMPLSVREENHLEKAICSPVYHKVYNIEDTTYAETYPKVMDEIRNAFFVDERQVHSDLLDEMVKQNTWECPIEIVSSDRLSGYDRERDVICIHDKGLYCSDKAYYSDLLRAMARSTGSEMRMDRDIWSSLPGDRLYESLVTEISAASMGCILGISTTMSATSLKHLSEYISIIQGDQTFVYDAVKIASVTTHYMEDALGIDLSKKLDLHSLMKSHYPAKSAQMEQKNEQRKNESKNYVPRKQSRSSSRRHM